MPEIKMKNRLKFMHMGWKIIGIIAVVGAIIYLFWGADFLPDVGWTGYLDDLVLLLVAIRVFSKYGGKPIPGTGKQQNLLKQWSLMAKLIFIAFIGIATAYLFWGPDLIPDALPWIGYLDDLLAVIGLYKIFQHIFGEPVDIFAK